MAEGKKSFVLYADLLEVVEEMTNEEAGLLLKTILRYVNDLEPEVPKEIKLAFIPIKQDLKRDLEKWNEIKTKRKAAINKRWKKNTSQVQNNTNNTNEKAKQETNTNEYAPIQINTNEYKSNDMNSVNVNVNDNVNVNVISSKDDVYINNNLEQNALAETARREALFNKFWESYPKKKNKDKCKKWFMNKNRKVDEALIDEMINAILIQSTSEQWQKSNGQFIPYPYTWLNGGGWKDEIDTDVIDDVIPNGGFEEL